MASVCLRTAALALVPWLVIGCAQDQGFLADGWAGAPGAQRVLLLPTNFDATPPNYLAAGTERLTDAIALRVESSDRELVRLRSSDALAAAKQSARELRLTKTYDPDVVRPHLATKLAREHDADLILIPRLVVRDAEVVGASITWDGATDGYRVGEIPEGWRMGRRAEKAALSIRIVGFDSRGEEVVDAYGGLESLYTIRILQDGFAYEVSRREHLLEDPAVIRDGVERALSELLGPPGDITPTARARRRLPGVHSWRRGVRGPFTVVSNAPEAVARALARQATRFLAVAEEVTGLQLDPSHPMKIIAFAEEEGLRRYHREHVLGHAITTAAGTHVAVSTESALLRVPVLYHEVVHILLFQNPDASYPAWYHEGLAEMLGSTAIQEDLASLNLLPNHRLRTLIKSPPVPLDELLDQRSFADLPPHRADRYYTDAWVFVFLLHTSHLNGGPDYREHLRELLERISRGESWRTGLPEAFDRSVEEIDREYRTFRKALKKRRVPLERYRVTDSDETSRFERMRAREVQIALGEYALAAGDLSNAIDHFWRARNLKPEDPAAVAGLARAWIRAGELDRAATALREYPVHLNSEENRPLLSEVRAELMIARHSASAEKAATPPGEDLLSAARALLWTVVEAEPRRAVAWRLLGTTHVLDPVAPPEPGIRALRRARTLLPALLDVQLDLGVLLARQGNLEAARVHISRALASHDAALVEEAKRRLETLPSTDASPLSRWGGFGESASRLRRRAPRSPTRTSRRSAGA